MNSPAHNIKTLGTALLISDEKALFDVYALNLRNYLSSELLLALNYEAALEMLKKHSNIGTIITKSCIKSEMTAKLIKSYFIENEIFLPMIIIGEDHDLESLDEQTVCVEGPANVKSILKSCSQFLKITAKAMIELEVPRFYPFAVDYFLDSDTPPCDIYFHDAENNRYFKRFTGGFSIDLDRLKKDRDAGLKELYVLSSFRLELTNQITTALLDKLQKSEMAEDDRKKVTDRAMNIIGNQFRDSELNENAIKLAHASVQSLQKVVSESPELSILLKSLVNEPTSYRFKHCQLITYFSNVAIDHMKWGTKEHKEKMAFAVFFHDLFLYNDEEAMIERDEEVEGLVVEKAAQERIKNHAALACEKVIKFPRLPLGADQIILQHHGARNGRGYQARPGADLSPLSQVFIICEALAKKVLFYEQGDDFLMAVQVSLKELEDQFRKPSYQKIIYALQDAKWE